MSSKKIVAIFLIITGYAFSQVDTSWTYKKNKIVIPFELSNNLIIVKVNLNGVDLNMIVDTGSDINLLFRIPDEEVLPVNEGKTTTIMGLGSKEPIKAIISSSNEIRMNEFVDKDFEILIINQDNISLINKFGIEINGILGYSFFKNNVIEVDYVKGKITIYKDIDIIKNRKIKRFFKEEIRIIDNKPYININSKINLQEIILTLLIDTGLSDGLWLFKNESIRYSNNNIDDILGQGLSGDILGKRTRIDKVKFSDFFFDDILVSFPEMIFFENIKIVKGRNGSVGGELLKRFNLIIDYSRRNIYFKKNKFYREPFHFNMSGIEVRHSGKEIIEEKIELNRYFSKSAIDVKNLSDNKTSSYKYKYLLKPTYKISHIRKNSPASEVDLKVGDKIISINNRKAYNYTIQKITDLFQSEDGKKIKMEVEREGKVIEVVFYLKKII